jgi:Flp pilus assembly protein TadG
MKLIKFRKGQMAIVMTLAIATLLGVMALGADVGVMYYNWGQLQKAADAAAVAGANKLTGRPDTTGTVAPAAISYANGYACLNGVNDPNNSSATVCPSPTVVPSYTDKILFTTVDSGNTQVSISVNRLIPYSFGRVLGLQTGAVTVLATAKVYTTNGANGIFPAVLNCPGSPCNFAGLNVTQNFGVKFTAGVPGNWGWLDVGQGQGGSQLKGAIGSGYSGYVSVGQTLRTDNGGKNGPINDGWTALLAQHQSQFPSVDPNSVCANSNPGVCSSTITTGCIPTGDPLLVTVPVGDMSLCTTGNCSINVTGFAEVYLTGLSASGQASNATISGCFVSAVGGKTVGGPGGTGTQLGSLGKPILIQ